MWFNTITLKQFIGSNNRDNTAVIPTSQTNKGIRPALIFIGFMFIIVEIKFDQEIPSSIPGSVVNFSLWA